MNLRSESELNHLQRIDDSTVCSHNPDSQVFLQQVGVDLENRTGSPKDLVDVDAERHLPLGQPRHR